jgi:hypothetical protein
LGCPPSILVEAASLGIPAISIENDARGRSEFSHSFMPDFGKGIIWDSASNASEVIDRIRKINSLIDQKPEEIAGMGKRYKEMFFCEHFDQKNY